MDDRLYFVLGDLLSNIVIGALIGVVVEHVFLDVVKIIKARAPR